MHEQDAGVLCVGWRPDLGVVALHPDSARRRVLLACNNFSQSRPAGAVGAADRQNLAAVSSQCDVAESLHSRIFLANLINLEHNLGDGRSGRLHHGRAS